LEAAIVAHGIDLGRRPDVRERAIAAAAKLMNERGLEAATLDRVATEAQCSVPSLHAIFGTRDGLLTAVFDVHGPLSELEALAANSSGGPERRVRAIYRSFINAFEREPRVLPALFADLLSRPEGPANRLLKAKLPRAMRSIEALLGSQVMAGQSRRLPSSVIIELLLGPLFFHALFTPRIGAGGQQGGLSADELADTLTESFLSAVSHRKH
jgi:AcrR family transcriptional regulator